MIKNCENAGIKHANNSKAFIKCSNTMNDIYENIDDYNPSRKTKILIIFDDCWYYDKQKIPIINQRIIY